MWAYPISLLAGALTTLSPCVLPVLPFVVGSTAQGNRYTPLAMAGGMITAFTVLGVLFASAGSFIGLEQDAIRTIAAILLIVAGAAMLIPQVQGWMQKLFTPIANAGDSALQKAPKSGLWGGLSMGLLLGAVWSPCAGPTLGAAIGLASQGGMGRATIMMLLFGIGAVTPLLIVAYASAGLFAKLRGKLLSIGNIGKYAFGILAIVIGTGILTGGDKVVEAWVLQVLPEAWIDLTTIY